MLKRVVRMLWPLLVAACAQLPDAGVPTDGGSAPVQIDSARGSISTRGVAAILAGLKARAGELDILEQHLAIEQAIVGSALSAGNRVLLLQDGTATYRAMFAAIASATDHINLESYIIEDDEIGARLSELLLNKRAQGVHVHALSGKAR